MSNQPTTTLARGNFCKVPSCPRTARRNVNGRDLCRAHHERLLDQMDEFINGPEMAAVEVLA